MIDLARGLSAHDHRELAAQETRVVAADGGRLKLEWPVLANRAGVRPQPGRGIGRDVLRRVCRELRDAGVRRIGLEVAVENEHALGLYRSEWYLAPNGSSMAVPKMRGGLVGEIGIGDRLLTTGAKARLRFLKSFS